MNDKLRSANLNYLFKAILSLEDMEECYNFFEDLCTASELCEMSKRLEVARHRRQNRTQHCYYQPCKPLPEIRLGRIPENT